MMDWFTYGGLGFAVGVFFTMGLAWAIWRRSPARAIVDSYWRARLRLKGVGSQYAATYESTVSGGGVSPSGDPRDEKVLEHAKHLASRHSELIRLEFNGETIWTREDGWMGGDGNGH